MPIFFPSYLTKKCQNSDFLVYSQVVLLVIFGAKIQMRHFLDDFQTLCIERKKLSENNCVWRQDDKKVSGFFQCIFPITKTVKKICEFFSLSFSDFLALPLSRKNVYQIQPVIILPSFFHVSDFSLTLGIFTKKVVQSQNWFFSENHIFPPFYRSQIRK